LDASELAGASQCLTEAIAEYQQVTYQSSAAGRQLEQQREKVLQQEQTWKERAKLVEENDPGFAKQARHRCSQYAAAARVLSQSLDRHQKCDTSLQQSLADLRDIYENIQVRLQKLKGPKPDSQQDGETKAQLE
jgi:phage shock protein A